jgi:hypothetical protein
VRVNLAALTLSTQPIIDNQPNNMSANSLSAPQLVNLEARLDQILFRAPQDEEEGASAGTIAKRVAVGGAIGGAIGGASRLNKYVKNKYGNAAPLPQGVQGPLPAASSAQGWKNVGADMKYVGADAVKTFKSYRAGGPQLRAGLGASLKAAGKKLIGGLKRFDSIEGIQHLNALCDGVIELGESDDKKKRGGLGVAAGVATAGALGHKKVMSRYNKGSGPYAADGGLRQEGVEGAKRAYKQAGRDVSAGAKRLKKKAIGAAEHAGSVVVGHGKEGIKAIKGLIGRIRR